MLLTINNIYNFTLLCTPAGLETKEGREILLNTNKENPLSHYMLCESDRLRIFPTSIQNNREKIKFVVMRQINEYEWLDHEVSMPAMLEGRLCKLSTDNGSVILTSECGRKVTYFNTFLFLEMLASAIGASEALTEILRLSVMYIGKTEIKENYIRFDGHEKLMSSLAQVVERKPHREIWIKMLSFQPPRINMLVLPGIESNVRHDWLPGGGLIEAMPQEELVNIIEVTLIKYFQPEYNVRLKINFPSDRHVSYNYFYNKSIRSIMVELHEEFRCYITGNASTPYTKIKMIEYALSRDDQGAFINDNNRQDLDSFITSLNK